MEVFVAAICILCVVCLFKIRQITEKADRMRTRLYALEEAVDAAQEREEKIAAELGKGKTSFSRHDIEQKKDLHRLTVGLQKLEDRVSAMEGELKDANEVMEAQARQEKLLFDGLNAIMDYDIGTARKAVSADAE